MNRNSSRGLSSCCCFLAVALLCITLAVPASRADSITYSTFTDPCTAITPGFYFVSVTLNLSAPAKSLKMSAPYLCGIPISWHFPVSGPANDMTVDLGGCISGSVVLYSAAISFNGPACCPGLFKGPRPDPTDPGSAPILIGCDDQPRYLIPPCSTPAPSLLTPSDGAVVTQTPTLEWSHNYNLGSYCEGLLGVPVFKVVYGTDPANLDHTLDLDEMYSVTLPLLLPNTQYFWRVQVWDEVVLYTGSQFNFSEISSFTTNDVVSTEQTTWGYVKSIYKD